MSDVIRVAVDPPGRFDVYATVSSAFDVRAALDGSVGAVRETLDAWTVRDVRTPYRKDYDAVPGNHPTEWPRLLHRARTRSLGAYDGACRIGGAVVLCDGPEVELLEGRRDLALLWDLRVAPGHRGRGIGALLFAAAATWARTQGCRELRVETQDTNVPACRFYARQGCRLVAVRPHVYELFPEEAQLLWQMTLTPGA